MADNYLERHYASYEARKAAWEREKRLGVKARKATPVNPLHRLNRVIAPHEWPTHFNNPFIYTPHPLCLEAARHVEAQMERIHADLPPEAPREGKMLGVLLVQTTEGQIGYLAAFSGLLLGKSRHAWFVPPIYDLTVPYGHFRQEEAAITQLNQQIDAREEAIQTSAATLCYQESLQAFEAEMSQRKEALKAAKAQRHRQRASGLLTPEAEQQLIAQSQFQKAEQKRWERQQREALQQLHAEVTREEEQIAQLKQERKERSAALQQWLFEQYRIENALGQQTTIWQLFAPMVPPAGTGDCAAPKLIHYAYQHGWRPLAMAEWWWGPSPQTEVRQAGTFYPSCRGKCGPLLTYMLQGLTVEPPLQVSLRRVTPLQEVEVLYEDPWLAVVNKPAGLCSVPGIDPMQPSLLTWAKARYPQAQGPLIVHRLDMDTSGVMVIALTPEVALRLQRQFLEQRVEKHYIADVEGLVEAESGLITLPLAPDLHDRPRQMVHPDGKPAETRYQVIKRCGTRTRVRFTPLSGRTHQIRVHAAHPQGLNHPIVGDPLYGSSKREGEGQIPAERLHLHAEQITFTHPIHGQSLTFKSEVPF